MRNEETQNILAGEFPGGSVGQGSGVAMSCGVGGRRGLDPALLWLWCRAAATAPIRSLAWEPPYAVGAAQEKTKKNNNNKIK